MRVDGWVCRVVRCLLQVSAFFVFSSAHALIEIEITQAVDTALPIAVLPFAGDAPLPLDLASVIRADFDRSGFFKATGSQVEGEHRAQQQLDIGYWRDLGVDSVIVGHVEPLEAGAYRVQFDLVDTFRGMSDAEAEQQLMLEEGELVWRSAENHQALLSRVFEGVTTEQLRALAHHIADLAYEKLTGTPGAFSTQIAYINVKWEHGFPSEYTLEVSDADGYNPHALVVSPHPLMSPTWSPDGRMLAYVSFENFRSEIYLVDVASGERERVSAFSGINGAPSWSPDGEQLAVVLSHSGSPKIYTMDIASQKLKQLTFGWSIDTEPRWSPDGRRIAFTSNRGGKPQIYEVELGTGHVSRLTYEGDYNARASYTPDGKNIVMLHRSGATGKFNIATQDINTGALTILTESSLDESPSIAPNGSMVIYATSDGTRRVLAAVSIDGRVHLKLPARSGDVQEPAWSPYITKTGSS